MKFLLDFTWLTFFINSNTFVGLSTVFTGVAAYTLYVKQKRDNKKKAAVLILSEIRNAESKIKNVRDRLSGKSSGDFPMLLPINNWEKYSYLFAKDFDEDELSQISNFFSNCALIDEFAKKDNNFFWVTTEERARVIQQQLPQIIIASFDKEKSQVDQQKVDVLKRQVLDTVSNEAYAYSPKKTINNIEMLINNLDKITTTTIGQKLKRIAK